MLCLVAPRDVSLFVRRVRFVLHDVYRVLSETEMAETFTKKRVSENEKKRIFFRYRRALAVHTIEHAFGPAKDRNRDERAGHFEEAFASADVSSEIGGPDWKGQTGAG